MNCLVCGVATENPKYCSKSCSAKVSNKGRNRHGTNKRFCINCKKQLIRSDAQYCSNLCNITDRRNKRIQQGSATDRMVKTHLLKQYGAKCMLCGWAKENVVTNRVPIELDHIDGNSSNNDLNNVRLLCPNCHSIQPTYKALNKGKGRHSRLQRYKDGKSY